MLKTKINTSIQFNRLNRARHLVKSIILGAAIACSFGVATASAAVDSFRYAFKATMTNTAVDTDARGTIQGTVNQHGTVDAQRLKIAVSKLDPNTPYRTSALLGEDLVPVVNDFTTDKRGSSSIMGVKNNGTHPLPAGLDPITNLRELDVLNANGDTVLHADLTSPNPFSYSVRRAMQNTGFLAGAAGLAQVSGSSRATKVSIKASGLTPATSYQLMVNDVAYTTKAADKRGKLTLTGPKVGLPLVLDIRTVALADSSTNLILIVDGLGIPGSPVNTGPASIVLGAAAGYAVLAGSTVTSTGGTTLNGDLGVSPGTAVTGFPPGVINGTIHAGDTASAQAQLDLTTAYNDAAGRTVNPISVAGNLGGQTLSPGLYKSTSSLEISSGDLTLDAGGNANAVFIFQIASTLTTTSGRQVILSGGARAENIFWQVGSSATLGTTSVFKGTIMADQSITLETGATLDGRALARIAAVTMDSNTVGLGTSTDTTKPTVSSADPADAATGVAVNQKVAVSFAEAMDPSTINSTTFTLNQGATAVAGTVTYAGTTATFSPASALAANTVYTATITTGATDLAGNPLLSALTLTFTTGAAADATPPTASSSVPVNGATSVAINQHINATFSEAMDPTTLNTASFTLTGPGATPVTGTVTYDTASKIATFAPSSNLAASTLYTATLTTGATDLAGNALAANAVWTFTTANTVAGQAKVVLGAAANYAVLAGPTATSINATTLNGDLGVSPGTAVTGFPPGLINGTIHAGDIPAAQAQLDLTTAYNDAAGRTVNPVSVAGNLGGQTLAPGLYKSTSSLEISSGDLTLDAQGDANAVFIFQMASTLTTTSGRQVILSGGAKAANVFWQVGTSATLGTTSVFKGTIMADQSITLNTGATLDGRALARIAAVTMDSNSITLPTP